MWSLRIESGFAAVGFDRRNSLLGHFHAEGYVTSSFMEQTQTFPPYWRDRESIFSNFSAHADGKRRGASLESGGSRRERSR